MTVTSNQRLKSTCFFPAMFVSVGPDEVCRVIATDVLASIISGLHVLFMQQFS